MSGLCLECAGSNRMLSGGSLPDPSLVLPGHKFVLLPCSKLGDGTGQWLMLGS